MYGPIHKERAVSLCWGTQVGIVLLSLEIFFVCLKRERIGSTLNWRVTLDYRQFLAKTLLEKVGFLCKCMVGGYQRACHTSDFCYGSKHVASRVMKEAEERAISFTRQGSLGGELLPSKARGEILRRSYGTMQSSHRRALTRQKLVSVNHGVALAHVGSWRKKVPKVCLFNPWGMGSRPLLVKKVEGTASLGRYRVSCIWNLLHYAWKQREDGMHGTRRQSLYQMGLLASILLCGEWWVCEYTEGPTFKYCAFG